MAVVSISREYGAGGTSVGELVAKRLGCRLIDHAVLAQVAKEAKVSERYVEGVDYLAGEGLWTKLAEILTSRYVGRYFPGMRSEFDEARYLKFLKQVIREIAAQGDVVFLGRGSQFILQGDPRAIKVLLVAEEAKRIESLMARFGLGRDKAEHIARQEEKRRLNFLDSFEAGDPRDPHLYNLVINTSRENFDTVADLICRLAEVKGR